MWTGRRGHTVLTGVLLLFALAPGEPRLAAQPPPDPTDEFFNAAVVRDIRITMRDRDWALLHEKYLENTYYPCTFEWNGMVLGNATLRSRGSGTRNPYKPGLRIDFNRYDKSQRFLGLKYVVLDNFWQDPSMIRERVSMLLLARLGVAAPRETHVRMFVNDAYVGLYGLVEAPDEIFTARVLGSGDGYLYEYNWQNQWHFEYLGPDLSAYRMFDPKTHTSDPEVVLWGPFERLTHAANFAPDATFTEDVGAYLDLRQVVRQVAFENFLADSDGLVGAWGLDNFYVYRAPDSTRFTILQWDKDNTFHAADYPIMSGVAQNVVLSRALTVGGLHGLYLAAMQEAAEAARGTPTDAAPVVRPGSAGGDGRPTPGARERDRTWMQREIAYEYRLIRGAAKADPFKATSNETFDAAVQELLTFAGKRPDFVAVEVEKERARRGASAISR